MSAGTTESKAGLPGRRKVTGGNTLQAMQRSSIAPITLTLFGVFLAIFPAMFSTSEQHARWGVEWYMRTADYLVLALSATAVLVGICLGKWRGALEAPDKNELVSVSVAKLWHATNILLFLCLAGYIVWLISAVQNGLTFALALEVFRGDTGASYSARDVLVTVPGVSTLTQVGPVLVAALAVLWRLGHRRYVAMTIVLVLALIRAVLNSERLAVIEVLVPILVVFLATVPTNGSGGRPGHKSRLALLVYSAAPILLVVYFALTERNRSWGNHYSSTFDGGLLSFSVDRLWAYYATGTNNGVIYSTFYAPLLHMPELTLAPLLNAPIIGEVLSFLGVAPNGTTSWQETLASYGNPEFNNPSAFLPIIGEIGVVPACFMFLIWGFVLGRLYSGLRCGSVVALCGYAAVCIGLLELARYPYYLSTRVVPVILALWILSRVVREQQSG